jgi:hypothetical protein
VRRRAFADAFADAFASRCVVTSHSIQPRHRVIRSRATGFVRTHGQPHTHTYTQKDLVHTRTRNYDVLHERTHDEPRGDAEGDDDQGAKGDQRARDACGDARWAI